MFILTKKEIGGLSEDEIRIYQEIEKFIAHNDGRSPNIKELAEVSGFSQYKVKRVLKSLRRKGILNIKQEGSSKRPEIVKFIIPAFLGGTGAFVGFRILTERQMKKVVEERQKEEMPIKTLFPDSQTETGKSIETITIPERGDSREIVYVPSEGGYKPQPINVLYQPAPIDFGDKSVNVYSGGVDDGKDFDELWEQILTIVGDKNCAQQYKGDVQSGIMSYQEVYQICAQEGADVDIHSDVGDFERMMCHASGSYWDKDHCDRSRKPDGTPKDSSEKTTMEDVLTGTYDYKEDTTKDGQEGYNPFEQWQKDYGKDAELNKTETEVPSSPQFSPVTPKDGKTSGLFFNSGSGKTPCASHSTEAECRAAGCTWFSWTNACG